MVGEGKVEGDVSLACLRVGRGVWIAKGVGGEIIGGEDDREEGGRH